MTLYHHMWITEVWDILRPKAIAEFKRQLGAIGCEPEDIHTLTPFELEGVTDAVDCFNKTLFDELNLWSHPELLSEKAENTENEPF